MTSWSNDEVLEFIELYKREQLIWDSKHPANKNKREVADAWIRIQNSLSIQCAITDLKKKKESLMTSFRFHVNKKRTQEGYRTTWFAYPLMESFLGGKYECDSTNHHEHELYTNTGNYNTQPEVSNSSSNANRNNITMYYRTDTEKLLKIQKDKTSQNMKPSPEIRYHKKRSDETINTRDELDITSEIDEYDLFGQLLAKKLRKLDEHQRDVAMHEIDNVMFRAKMQPSSILPTSYSTTPSPSSRKLKSPIFIVAQNSTNGNIQFEDENLQYQEQPPS